MFEEKNKDGKSKSPDKIKLDLHRVCIAPERPGHGSKKDGRNYYEKNE